MAVVLGFASQAAMALGLGDIRVLSQPGQPLLAEIPVVSADPGELESARVALASPATFARVGLSPPDGLVSALRFDLAQNAQGMAVIRVTSDRPVSSPVVSFLVEVDWGRGRLVREYSALVDRPQTAQAATLPQINAPEVVASNAIVREVAPAVPTVQAKDADDESPVTTGVPAPEPKATPAAAVPVAPPVGAARASGAVAFAPGDATMVVERGQTLSHIAGRLAREHGVSLDQSMIALMQANPHAFVGGSMHKLRAGAVLELPGADVLASVNQSQARAMVREQRQQWGSREAAALTPSPTSPEAGEAPAKVAAPSGAASQQARLEIAPAAASADSARSIETGTVAGGQGDMQVSEQLRQAQEDLATRDAEIADLRERVAELEKLREQQQALIELKDNEMAAAAQSQAGAAQADSAGGNAGWLWGGGLLLVGAAFVAWLARRRKPSPLPPLADVFPEQGIGGRALRDTESSSPAASTEDFLFALDKARTDALVVSASGDVGVADVGHHGDVAAMPVGEGETVVEAPVAEDESDVRVSVEAPAVDESDVVAGDMFEPTSPVGDALSQDEECIGSLDSEVAASTTEVQAMASDNEDLFLTSSSAVDQAPVVEGDAAVAIEADDGALAALEVADARVQDLISVALETAPALALEESEGVSEPELPVLTSGDDAIEEPAPGTRERLELAIAYLDLGDPETARSLLEEVAAAADQSTRFQAQELLARLD